MRSYTIVTAIALAVAATTFHGMCEQEEFQQAASRLYPDGEGLPAVATRPDRELRQCAEPGATPGRRTARQQGAEASLCRRTEIIITPKLDQFLDLVDKASDEAAK